MEERIKELLKEYQDKVDFHSCICEDYIKKYGYDKCDYITHHKSMYHYFSGAIQALRRILP